mgnify:CR=1 FL=1
MLAFENAREQAAQVAGYTAEEFFALFDTLAYRLFDIFMKPFGPDRRRGDAITYRIFRTFDFAGGSFQTERTDNGQERRQGDGRGDPDR